MPSTKTFQFRLDGIPYSIPWNQKRVPTNEELSQLAASIRATEAHRMSVLEANQPQVPTGIDIGKVAAYQQEWFDDPANSDAAPAKLLQKIQKLPLDQRDATIPKNWSPVGRTALLQAAYRLNPTFPVSVQYNINSNLQDLGITESQARQQGIANAVVNKQIANNRRQNAQNLALQKQVSDLSNVQLQMQRGQLPIDYDTTYMDHLALQKDVDRKLAAVQAKLQKLPSFTPLDEVNRMVGASARTLMPDLLGTNPVMESALAKMPTLGEVTQSLPPGSWGEAMIPGLEKYLQEMPGYTGGLVRGAYGAAAPTNLAMMAALPFTGLGNAMRVPFAIANGANLIQSLADTDTLRKRGVGAYLGQSTIPAAFAALGAYGLRGQGESNIGGADASDATPRLQNLLPAPPDPNVYEAQFQPRPPEDVGPSAVVPLVSGRPGYIPQNVSAMLANGFALDPYGDTTQQTSRPILPPANDQGTIILPRQMLQTATDNIPNDVVTNNEPSSLSALYSIPDYVTHGTAMQARPDHPTRWPTVMPSGIGLDPQPSHITPAAGQANTRPPILRVPLPMTSDDSLAISKLFGEQHPFSMAMDRLFSDGRTKTDVPLTLPQLNALRDLAEHTKSLTGNTPGSYNRPAFIKRISMAARNFPEDSVSAGILPQTVV